MKVIFGRFLSAVVATAGGLSASVAAGSSITGGLEGLNQCAARHSVAIERIVNGVEQTIGWHSGSQVDAIHDVAMLVLINQCKDQIDALSPADRTWGARIIACRSVESAMRAILSEQHVGETVRRSGKCSGENL